MYAVKTDEQISLQEETRNNKTIVSIDALFETRNHDTPLVSRITPLKAGDEEAKAQVPPRAAADAHGRVLLGEAHVRQAATRPRLNGRRRGKGRTGRRLARAPKAVAGRPVGRPLAWEYRADQSHQAHTEEA